MSAFNVVALWVVCALFILLTFVGMSIWYRRTRVGRPEGYVGLKKINAIAVCFRLFIILLASAGVYYLLRERPGFQSILLAPSLWACIAIVGYVILDLVMMGHSSSVRVKRAITTYVPGKLLLLTLAYFAGLVVACWFTSQRATPDGKTYVAIWMATDGFRSARLTPFVGLFYTVPLVKALGIVLGAAIVGMVIVSLRHSYLPQEDYILLDRSLRRRVTRDIVLALLLAVSASLLIVCIDVVWALTTVGPDNTTRVAYAVAGIVVGIWMFVTACWALANLIFLVNAQEDWDHGTRQQVGRTKVHEEKPEKPEKLKKPKKKATKDSGDDTAVEVNAEAEHVDAAVGDDVAASDATQVEAGAAEDGVDATDVVDEIGDDDTEATDTAQDEDTSDTEEDTDVEEAADDAEAEDNVDAEEAADDTDNVVDKDDADDAPTKDDTDDSEDTGVAKDDAESVTTKDDASKTSPSLPKWRVSKVSVD